jgi:hypothetical protein
MPELEPAEGAQAKRDTESRNLVISLAKYVTVGATVVGALVGGFMQYNEMQSSMEEQKDKEIARMKEILEEKYQASQRSQEAELKGREADHLQRLAQLQSDISESRAKMSEQKLDDLKDDLERVNRETTENKQRAQEALARSEAATRRAAEQQELARLSRRQLARTHYGTAVYHAGRRDHRKAILEMRSAIVAAEEADTETAAPEYKEAMDELLSQSPGFLESQSVPAGRVCVSFVNDESVEGRRTALLVGGPARQRRSPRQFAPWRDGTYLYVDGLGLLRECREQKLADGVALFAAADAGSDPLFARADEHFMTCLATDPDRGLVAVGTLDGSVIVYSQADGVAPAMAENAHSGPVETLAFRPGHGELITAGADGRLCRWSAKARKAGEASIMEVTLLLAKKAHSGFIRCLAVHNNGDRLATAGGDNAVHVWSVQDLGRLEVLAGHEQEVGRLEFHPGRALVASQSWDGTVRLWDFSERAALADRQLVARLDAPNDSSNMALSFSSDGTALAALTNDGTGYAISRWSIPSGRRRAESLPLDDRIRKLGINPGELAAESVLSHDAQDADAEQCGFAATLRACKKAAAEGRSHLRAGRPDLAMASEIESHRCHPLNEWATGLHSEIREYFIDRVEREVAALYGTKASWVPALDEWFRVSAGNDGWSARLRRELMGEGQDRRIRMGGVYRGMTAVLDTVFNNAVATGETHQAHRLLLAETRFEDELKKTGSIDAIGPDADVLLAQLDTGARSKSDTLYEFDPPLKRRYGFAQAAEHRLEAGSIHIAGGFELHALGPDPEDDTDDWDGSGEGNLVKMSYTWRQRPPKTEGTSAWWGLTLSTLDYEAIFDPDGMQPDKLFIGMKQSGAAALWGRRWSRGSWWLGGGLSQADVRLDGFSWTDAESLPSADVRVGFEYALYGSRTGPDVSEGFGGTLAEPGENVPKRPESKSRWAMSLYAQVEYGDWGYIEEFSYLRYQHTTIGLRFYPSPYFAIAVNAPFTYFEANGSDLNGTYWNSAESYVHATVLVQF